MKITVEMTAEEYDLFRAYQRDKGSLERELSSDYEHLRKEHEALCSAVVDALERDEATLYAEGEPVETSHRVQIKDSAAAARAVNLAADWYA